MEIEEEVFEDPKDNEQVTFKFSEKERKLFEKRGFFSTESGFIDDTFYTIRKEINENTHLNGNLSVQDLVILSFEEKKERLFMKDSMIIQSVDFLKPPLWNDLFAGEKIFYDVDPLCLEPYIAKYVRIINRCGMRTFYSCDGWHRKPQKSREIVILFRDRYSFFWHKGLCKIFIKDDFRWMYKENSESVVRFALPSEDERKKRIYDKLNISADVFILNCEFLKRLKESFVNEINNQGIKIDDLSDIEVEEKMKDFLSKNNNRGIFQ